MEHCLLKVCCKMLRRVAENKIISNWRIQIVPKISKGFPGAAAVSSCAIKPSRISLMAAAFAVASGLLANPSYALTFNVTYDSSVGSAPAGFQSAFQNAIGFYEASFSNPITINLNVGWGTLSGQTFTGLGGTQYFALA